MKSQSKFTSRDIKSKLEGYKEICRKDLAKIQSGDKLRYITNNEFRGGGVVKINKYPDYMVLINVMNKHTWSMQIKTDPTLVVYAKTKEMQEKEKEQKEKELEEMKRVYDMYKSGKLEKKK
tara:strand:+ start:174 stop:536 length:363 start_codon:yes stop_codon:yes gene_type:complete